MRRPELPLVYASHDQTCADESYEQSFAGGNTGAGMREHRGPVPVSHAWLLLLDIDSQIQFEKGERSSHKSHLKV